MRCCERQVSLGTASGGTINVIVLCVQTEPRDLLSHWLKTLPVVSIVARSGYHARKMLDAGACHLLVTDRMLPPWPGLGRFGPLRARQPHLRIAFVDNGGLNAWLLAQAVGATDFLPKPLSRGRLFDILARIEPQRSFLSLHSRPSGWVSTCLALFRGTG